MPFNDGTELVILADASQANATFKSVNTSLDRMELAAVKATRGASGGYDQMAVAAVKSQSAVSNFRGGIQAVEALEDEVVKLTAQTVQLRARLVENREAQEALNAARDAGRIGVEQHANQIRNLTIEEEELTKAQRQVAFSQRTARQDLQNLRFEARDTGGDLAVLAGTIGIHLPAAVTQFATRLAVVQGLVKLAFPAIVVTAFLGVLALIPAGIRKITESLAGWTEAAKKHFAELRAGNQEILRENREREIAQLRLNRLELGLTGLDLKKREAADLRKELGVLANAAADTERQIRKITVENEKLRGRIAPLGGIVPTFGARASRGSQAFAEIQEQIAQNDKALKDLGGTLDDLRKKQTDLQTTGFREADIATQQAAADKLRENLEERLELENAIRKQKFEQAQFDRELLQTGQDILAQTAKEAAQRNTQGLERQIERQNQFLELRRRGDEEVADAAIRNADLAKDAQLRQIEFAQVNAQSIQERIALEGQRAEIEVAHAEAVHQARMGMYRVESDARLAQFRLTLRLAGEEEAVIAQRVAALIELRDQAVRLLDEQAGAEQTAIRESAAVRQAQIIRTEQERIFNSIKQQAGGVFDAMLSRSRSVWRSIGDLFKTTILTAIKDTFTTAVAQILTPFLSQVRQGITGWFGGQRAGALGGFGAVLPSIFGGGGGFGIPGVGPGGTPPFLPPVQNFVQNILPQREQRETATVLKPEPIEITVIQPDPVLVTVVKPDPVELAVIRPDPVEVKVIQPDPVPVSVLKPDPVTASLPKPEPAPAKLLQPDTKLDLPNHLGDVSLVSGHVPVLIKPGKLEETNHLGDVALINRAVPVYLTNPAPVPQQASAAKELSSIAAALATVAPAITGLGRAGIPAGEVSSTINFGQGPLSTGLPTAFPGSPATPPFFPSPTAGAGGGPTSGLASLLPGLKQFLNLGGNAPASGIGPTLPFGQLSLGGKLSALGKSDAALLGGLTLALDGLRRGGKIGLAETTGGGALIGFRFGGPLGAAIGGAIGFGAGLFGLFRKSSEEKLREKIKRLYSVDIPDKGILRQILEVARSSFGGNLDVAIVSPQIKELIQLYALSSGQTGNFGKTLQPTSLVQSGGLVSQVTHRPGGLQEFSPLPSFRPTREPQASPPNITVIVENSLPGEAVGEYMEGRQVRTISRNPRIVQSAVATAEQDSSGRRERAARLSRPSLLTTAPGNR